MPSRKKNPNLIDTIEYYAVRIIILILAMITGIKIILWELKSIFR